MPRGPDQFDSVTEDATDPFRVLEEKILDLEGDLQSQLDAANEYVKQRPNHGRPYAVRSMVFADLDQTADQISDLNIAIRLLSMGPDQSSLLCESYFARGLAYQSLEQDDLAIENFTRLLDSRVVDPDVLQARAFSYLRTSMYEAALGDVDLAIEATPTDPFAYELRSRIRTNLGDIEGAESDLAEYGRLTSQR